MSATFHCDDKETLVAFLYDEIDDASRHQVERHLQSCAVCAREIEGFRAVRHDLLAWHPPGTAPDPTMATPPAVVQRQVRWSPSALPAWAQVAAAVLLLAGAAALANLQVRYGADGLMVSTGWMTTAAAPVPVVSAGALPAADEPWREALDTLERSIRREMESVRTDQAFAVAPATRSGPASVDVSAVLRRVEALLAESEQRQREELALRLAQLGRDIEFQRRTDLTRFERTVGQRTVESQREMYNLLRRVSTQVP